MQAIKQGGLNRLLGSFHKSCIAASEETFDQIAQSLELDIVDFVALEETTSEASDKNTNIRRANRAKLRTLREAYPDPNRYGIVSLAAVAFDSHLSNSMEPSLCACSITASWVRSKVYCRFSILNAFTAKVLEAKGCTSKKHLELINNDKS